MIDYRLLENRRGYFDKLYGLNLTHGIMPGLVYLYMPELAQRYGWDAEQRLWFAFLNGMTQNPITSLRLFTRLPSVPPARAALTGFEKWFNDEWDTLQFDTDRRYQKKETVQAIKTYAELVAEHGSQVNMLTGPYDQLWDLVRNRYFSFGRLSSFSYLEYVFLNGYGADCDDLLFSDKSGSRSHRNGMLFLLGRDELVWDKRANNEFDGNYDNFGKMCSWLNGQAENILFEFSEQNQDIQYVSYFTLESNLCTFKNHFFGRRYPGVYADMAQERIEWADARGQQTFTEVFKDIRAEGLPDWLRAECETERLSLREKAGIFPRTGQPYRAEYFITENLEHA
ncbi:MAG: hypothetical protein EBZ61_06135 [Micrococcales bacterium]|nr:hypothetical protein [Micrococcales bacterium]